MHSVMSGYTDKALSYADKAFQFMNVTPKSGNINFFDDFAISSPDMSCCFSLNIEFFPDGGDLITACTIFM